MVERLVHYFSTYKWVPGQAHKVDIQSVYKHEQAYACQAQYDSVSNSVFHGVLLRVHLRTGVKHYRSLPYPDSPRDPGSLMHHFQLNAVLREWPRR